MAYYHKVYVHWTDPVHINESYGLPSIEENGIYMITRKYIRNNIEWEALLYIGITTRSFYTRLSEHFMCNSIWCSAYGKKHIRLGSISIYKKSSYNLKYLLTDIESIIIQDLNNLYPCELLNIQQVASYTPHYNINITHINNDWLEEFNPL